MRGRAASGLVIEERRAELSLWQDLDEVLDTEHLLENVPREQRRIYRVLRAMCRGRSDLVADEVGDVHTRIHPGVDAIP